MEKSQIVLMALSVGGRKLLAGCMHGSGVLAVFCSPPITLPLSTITTPTLHFWSISVEANKEGLEIHKQASQASK